MWTDFVWGDPNDQNLSLVTCAVYDRTEPVATDDRQCIGVDFMWGSVYESSLSVLTTGLSQLSGSFYSDVLRQLHSIVWPL